MEKCSIIIAAYNEAENLKRCLNSLINVDYPPQDFEVIFVGNNSTNNITETVDN